MICSSLSESKPATLVLDDGVLLHIKFNVGDFHLDRRSLNSFSALAFQRPTFTSLSTSTGVEVFLESESFVCGVDVEMFLGRTTVLSRPDEVGASSYLHNPSFLFPFFSSHEVDWIQQFRSTLEQKRAALILWTRLESYLKMMKKGFSEIESHQARPCFCPTCESTLTFKIRSLVFAPPDDFRSEFGDVIISWSVLKGAGEAPVDRSLRGGPIGHRD